MFVLYQWLTQVFENPFPRHFAGTGTGPWQWPYETRNRNSEVMQKPWHTLRGSEIDPNMLCFLATKEDELLPGVNISLPKVNTRSLHVVDTSTWDVRLGCLRTNLTLSVHPWVSNSRFLLHKHTVLVTRKPSVQSHAWSNVASWNTKWHVTKYISTHSIFKNDAVKFTTSTRMFAQLAPRYRPWLKFGYSRTN